MSKKLKDLILFGIFILILFISTLTKQFSTDILYSADSGINSEFSGLIFQDPTEIQNLNVKRSVEKNGMKDLIKYDIEFESSLKESSLRVLGTPVRQIFEEGTKHSVVNLKGDYDKINEKLFNEKLSLRDFHKKTPDYKFKAVSQIRIPLKDDTYSFSICYEPKDLYYGDKSISQTTVFLTNSRVDRFTNSQKMGDNENPTFNESGYYVNAQEFKNVGQISRISLVNNASNIIFIVSVLVSLALIYLDKRSLSKLYYVLFALIVLSFYRLLGMGVTTIGVLAIMPVLSYIGFCIARLLGKDSLMLNTKELKQNLAYTIVFFIFVLVFLIIPRAL